MKQPWFRKSNQTWYVNVDGKQVRLDQDKKKAFDIWKKMDEARPRKHLFLALDDLAESFLAHAENTVSKAKYDQYAYYIASFCNECGTRSVSDIKPSDVTAWLKKHSKWKEWAQRTAIAAVKRVFNWGIEDNRIEKNPLLAVKRPAARSREATISDEQHAAMVEASRYTAKSRRFRQVLIALKHSGARPGTIAAVTGNDVAKPACDAWVVQEHKTAAKTGKPLTVVLTPCLQTLTRILLHSQAKEDRSRPLFLDSDNQPWNRNSIRLRMKRLRQKLGLPAGIVSYAYRHTFATRALVNGVDIATVAELLGHTSTAMVSKHYGHLDQAKEHLKNAVRKVNG